MNHLRQSLRHDTRGAAYVEFLIAFMPLFIAFVGLWELGELFVTKLMLSRAAFAGARAGAVYIPRPDETGAVTHQLTDASWYAVNDAVAIALAPALSRQWMTRIPDISLPADLRNGSASEQATYSPDAGTMVHVHLYGEYACHFPPIDRIFCYGGSTGGRYLPIEAHASFPYAGARYQYDPQ